jgi:hypothetical protein
MGYPYSDNNNAEQRTYNRKIEMLSAGLYPYVSDRPPIDLRVTLLAWGPGLPTAFSVDGYSTSNDEVNLWTGTFDVRSADSDTSRLNNGSVPYSIYAPGNSPAWLPWNGVNPIPVVVVPTGPMPTTMPGVIPTPTPAFYPGPSTQPPPGLRLDPYADLRYRLPAGTSPDSLKFSFSIGVLTAQSEIDLLAYNVDSGAWDRIGTWDRPAGGAAASTTGEIALQEPSHYTAPDGTVILRLRSGATPATLSDVKFGLSLNE